MAYDVTSWFVDQTLSKSPKVVRKFTIAGSDYSDRIMQWPSFSRKWDDIRPKTLKIKLANGDQGMNFLRTDKTKMEGACAVQLGFTHATSGDEVVTLFAGKIRSVSYTKEDCSVSIVDKFQQLSDRQVGTSDTPASYIGSSYLPSDLAWWTVTSYGGYSTVADSSNPDIDYEAFSEWAKVFSSDAVYMEAEFNGQKCTEILRKLARNTHSAIFIKEDKVSFHRFGIADTNVSSLGADHLMDMSLSFDTNDIINRQFVAGAYSVTSDYHTFTVLDESSSSVNSFGIKENTLKDANVWYVDSASAINLAQRMILSNAEPDDSVRATTGLVGLPRLIGETIYIDDSFHGIQESYRVLEHKIDMDKGRIDFRIDRTQLSDAFVLDSSSLDGEDVLT